MTDQEKDCLIENLQTELAIANGIIEVAQSKNSRYKKTLADIEKFLDTKDRHYTPALKKIITLLKETNGLEGGDNNGEV